MAGPYHLPNSVIAVHYTEILMLLWNPSSLRREPSVLGAEINTWKFTLPRQTLGYDDSDTHRC